MKWDVTLLMPGMELAADLYPNEGSNIFLLPKGEILTEKTIEKIRNRKIKEVEVIDYGETFIAPFRDIARNTLKTNNVEEIQKSAQKFAFFAKREEGYKFNMERYITDDLNIRNHAVNTAAMAVAIADQYNKNSDPAEMIPLHLMAEAALLSDIGRNAAKSEVLKALKDKYGKLLERYREQYSNIPEDVFDVYHPEQHAFYSYLLLKEKNIDYKVLNAILFHNERELDEKGPLGVKMGDANKKSRSIIMSRILKTCDLYDLILYRAKEEDKDMPFVNIQDKLNRFSEAGLIDPYWAKLVSLVVPIYPLGSKVVLNDGRIATVTGINENDMTKPLVIDEAGNEIDLSTSDIGITNIYIKPTEPDMQKTLA